MSDLFSPHSPNKRAREEDGSEYCPSPQESKKCKVDSFSLEDPYQVRVVFDKDPAMLGDISVWYVVHRRRSESCLIVHLRAPEELEARRRLVKFTRHQEGSNIRLSFTPISVKDAAKLTGDPSCSIINCALLDLPNGLVSPPRKPTKTQLKAQLVSGEAFFPCETEYVDPLKVETDSYITSVDILNLFELIVNPAKKRFSTDERRGLRRNIDNLFPITLRKDDDSYDGVGREILLWFASMAPPRPIAIAKDVKVFKWKFIEKALYKLSLKYVRMGSIFRELMDMIEHPLNFYFL